MLDLLIDLEALGAEDVFSDGEGVVVFFAAKAACCPRVSARFEEEFLPRIAAHRPAPLRLLKVKKDGGYQ